MCLGPILDNGLDAECPKGAFGSAHSPGARKRLLQSFSPPRQRLTRTQVKAARAEHGKKSFGPVVVDQLYG